MLERPDMLEAQISPPLDITKQLPSLADNDRMNQNAVLIDQVGVSERPNEDRAAERDDIAALSFLEGLDLLLDVVANELLG